MLVDLTPNIQEIERRLTVAKESEFNYIPQNHPQWKEETGIYQSSFAFNFPTEEFIEELEYDYNDYLYQLNKRENETEIRYHIRNSSKYIETYGVADNVGQIKEFYKDLASDPINKFVISVTLVWQEKENKGKGDGWRWHKWGTYIGKLNPQYEYLDDEDFGDSFEYVLCFHLYFVKP